MKVSPLVIFVCTVFVVLSLVGCQNAKATPDVSATVNAAVDATSAAQANLQATVDAAVKATAAAQPTATVVIQPTATVAAQKTAAPTAKPSGAAPTTAPTVNSVTLTEEQLAALIDQSVQEAVAATTAATTSTITSTADSTLTTQEVQAMQTSAAASQAEIDQALALAQAYYDLYADVSSETLVTLQAIEQDLNSMAQSMAQITQILVQGQATAQSAIAQLQAAAAKASSTAQSIQGKAKTWDSAVKTEIDKRATTALNVKPTSIPTDLRGTAQSVTNYIDTVRSALGDSKVSKGELNAISLAGANAVAGLSANGGTQFQGLSSSINGVTKQVARGETQNAKASLGNLEQASKSLTAGPGAGPRRP